MLRGLPVVFLSCSEGTKDTVGRPIADDLRRIGALPVIVSDEPFLGPSVPPDTKIAEYLAVSDIFVGLWTADDQLVSGQWSTRRNIVLEHVEARRLNAHLSRRMLIFKDPRVAEGSNYNLTYEILDRDDVSPIAPFIWRQLEAWNVVNTAPETSMRQTSSRLPVPIPELAPEPIIREPTRRGQVLEALGDPIRRDILHLLLADPLKPERLAQDLGVARPVVDLAIAQLQSSDLIRPSLNTRRYEVTPAAEVRRVFLALEDVEAALETEPRSPQGSPATEAPTPDLSQSSSPR